MTVEFIKLSCITFRMRFSVSASTLVHGKESASGNYKSISLGETYLLVASSRITMDRLRNIALAKHKS